jgi:hypothetical protein
MEGLLYRILHAELEADLPTAHRERVEARLKGPDELAKGLQNQKEASRQWHAKRRRERAARPMGISSATYTVEERREMSRELYRTDETLREQHRANSDGQTPSLTPATALARRDLTGAQPLARLGNKRVELVVESTAHEYSFGSCTLAATLISASAVCGESYFELPVRRGKVAA